MNLKLYLLVRIGLIAGLCLFATAAYVLLREDRQASQKAAVSAESIGRQLELQLLRINAGFDLPERFPDLDLWKEVTTASGICVRFTSATTTLVRSVCSRSGHRSSTFAPNWFETLYRRFFHPDATIERPIRFKGRVYGSISVSLDAELETAWAWNRISDLITLSAFTVWAVCFLVYGAIRAALHPAQLIVAGLGKMQRGDLSYRLPNFELIEWQQTGSAINQLAATQEQLLSDRRKLTFKLMNVQEEERRCLARELHDEFGQCLTGIHAVAASIAHTAEEACPVLVPEAKNISRITSHIMTGLRALLLRLRPTEIDELGLEASLNSLVSEWNARCGGKIHFQLAIEGDLVQLPEPLPVTVYRITQECLTNIAKHSEAAHATVTIKTVSVKAGKLTVNDGILIRIVDDGIADSFPFAQSSGIGLIGIKERVSALGGDLTFRVVQPSGLEVAVWLPIPNAAENQR